MLLEASRSANLRPSHGMCFATRQPRARSLPLIACPTQSTTYLETSLGRVRLLCFARVCAARLSAGLATGLACTDVRNERNVSCCRRLIPFPPAISLIDARDSVCVIAELLPAMCGCFESARFVIDELRELGVDVVGWRKRASSQRQESLAELAESDGEVFGPCVFGKSGGEGRRRSG